MTTDQLKDEIRTLQMKRELQRRNLESTDRELAERKRQLARLTRKNATNRAGS